MHPCNFDATLTASLKILVLNFLSHHQAQDKNVLISYVYKYYKFRNEASAWRHIVGITQISVS